MTKQDKLEELDGQVSLSHEEVLEHVQRIDPRVFQLAVSSATNAKLEERNKKLLEMVKSQED